MVQHHACGPIHFLLVRASVLQEQSAQYWPSEKAEPEVYGSFQVELCMDDQMLSDYTTRKFKISLVDSVSHHTITLHACLLLRLIDVL